MWTRAKLDGMMQREFRVVTRLLGRECSFLFLSPRNSLGIGIKGQIKKMDRGEEAKSRKQNAFEAGATGKPNPIQI